MKYALVALFVVLYSLGHSSGKAHHSLRNLDDEEESASRSDRKTRCFGRLRSCQEHMETYLSDRGVGPMSMLPNFMKAGSKQVCSDLLSATQCTQEGMDDPICQNLPSVRSDIGIDLIAYFQRFCVDKYSELERNWLCLVNITENGDLNQCWDLHENLYYETCNVGPLVDCVVDWYKANSACEEEGLELLRDIYSRFKHIFHPCIQRKLERQGMHVEVSEDR